MFIRHALVFGLSTALLLGLALERAPAEVSSYANSDFYAEPIDLTQSVTPMVMINASQDHQLYFKAYNDYTDLDGDDVPDTTYIHNTAYPYYGYFDSYKCYDYDASDLRFEPAAVNDDMYCTGSNSGYWSGNFLNWVSMARIDIVRKILFGGHRRTDSSTETVLERTYLPHDAHAWAKYYDGTDLDDLTPFIEGTDFCTAVDAGNSDCNETKELGITFCNTTDVSNASDVSEDVTDPPLIKVINGNYSLWAGNERWQCTWSSNSPEGDNHSASNGNDSANSGIYAYTSSPDYNDGLGQKNYVARVVACDSNYLGEEKCKQYPSGNYKPIGLFQTYGDGDSLYFGQMAGSYSKNKSGGTLTYDVGSMSREINVDTDGTFIKTAVFSGGPETNNQAEGIINAWSLYRIIEYKHSDGTYGTSGLNANNCTWGLSSFSDGQCQNWGNPFAEIFLQSIRYFASESVSGDFRANDSNEIAGLNTPQNWASPLTSSNYCASLFTVNFNSSTISYDDDSLDGTSDGVGDMGSTLDSSGLTDVVGDGEGIHNEDWFVGENGTDNNQLCTEKTVSSLGSVQGLCPEAPRLEGSYRIAGLAHWAHTNDIDTQASQPLSGTQKIDTYSVALAGAVPQVEIEVPGSATDQVVKILPACRNEDVGGACALVDFKIVSQDAAAGTGKFYVNWEDSEQGGDFDQDLWGTVSYVVDNAAQTIQVTTDVHADSTSYAMGFGFIISGTTQDGYHAYSGIYNYTYADATGVTGCSNCVTADGAVSYTFTLDANSGTDNGSLLEDPLYYAAKWGGFEDSNNNDIPDVTSEWDEKNNSTGVSGADGQPDNFFYATNPTELEDSLNQVFIDILQRTSSGTAAAVVSTTAGGEGAIYQAYYEPSRQDSNGNEAEWVGSLQGFWLDSSGYMREDDGDGVLEDYQTDKVFSFFYDETESKTRAYRYNSTSASTFTYTSGDVTTIDIEDVNPLWNAREQLYLSGVTVTTQRTYSVTADNGRFIQTWIDADLDAKVDSGEIKDFTATEIASSYYGYMDVGSAATATSAINYIRGEEQTGYRSRTVDYDSDGTTEVMRLGDIVNSTPTVVGAPEEAFDLLYGDSSYATFRSQYANRRQVVYVGANDGLLHAFNGGFFNAANTSFTTDGYKWDGTAATEHPLGSEIWAYAPMNLLPHLKWLTSTSYLHVFYMDGKPRVFDAKIFTDDDDHPGGWGTVLVAGMRLGGGPMTIDTAADGLGNPNASDDTTMSSAFVVIDITNPEEEPDILGEIRVPNGTYTTNYPTVVTLGSDHWYLAFGSGPDTLSSAKVTSNVNPYLYVYALSDLAQTKTVTLTKSYELSGNTSTFVGNAATADWDLDFIADEVYFGLIGDADGDDGGLMRWDLNEDTDPDNWSDPTKLLNVDQPIVATPTLGLDEDGEHWIYAGTGRLFVSADKISTTQQTLYGVKDTDSSTLDEYNLYDVTDIKVLTDGTIDGDASLSTFTALESEIETNQNGWRLNLTADGSDPAERSLRQASLLGATLFATAYTPNSDQCEAEGTSVLFGLYYKTGTAYYDPVVFGSETSTLTDGTTGTESIKSVDLGKGHATTPNLHSGSGKGDDDVTVFTQMSTGAVNKQDSTTIEGKVRSGEASWREYPAAP